MEKNLINIFDQMKKANESDDVLRVDDDGITFLLYRNMRCVIVRRDGEQDIRRSLYGGKEFVEIVNMEYDGHIIHILNVNNKAVVDMSTVELLKYAKRSINNTPEIYNGSVILHKDIARNTPTTVVHGASISNPHEVYVVTLGGVAAFIIKDEDKDKFAIGDEIIDGLCICGSMVYEGHTVMLLETVEQNLARTKPAEQHLVYYDLYILILELALGYNDKFNLKKFIINDIMHDMDVSTELEIVQYVIDDISFVVIEGKEGDHINEIFLRANKGCELVKSVNCGGYVVLYYYDNDKFYNNGELPKLITSVTKWIGDGILDPDVTNVHIGHGDIPYIVDTTHDLVTSTSSGVTQFVTGVLSFIIVNKDDNSDTMIKREGFVPTGKKWSLIKRITFKDYVIFFYYRTNEFYMDDNLNKLTVSVCEWLNNSVYADSGDTIDDVELEYIDLGSNCEYMYRYTAHELSCSVMEVRCLTMGNIEFFVLPEMLHNTILEVLKEKMETVGVYDWVSAVSTKIGDFEIIAYHNDDTVASDTINQVILQEKYGIFNVNFIDLVDVNVGADEVVEEDGQVVVGHTIMSNDVIPGMDVDNAHNLVFSVGDKWNYVRIDDSNCHLCLHKIDNRFGDMSVIKKLRDSNTLTKKSVVLDIEGFNICFILFYNNDFELEGLTKLCYRMWVNKLRVFVECDDGAINDGFNEVDCGAMVNVIIDRMKSK